MSTQNEIKSAKREMHENTKLKAQLKKLQEKIETQALPFPLDVAKGVDLKTRYEVAIIEVITLLSLCNNSLESHIDDLVHEEAL